MKFIFNRLIIGAIRTLWAVIIAFMLGIHNFYKGEDKSLENIVKIELIEEQEDDEPNDKILDYQEFVRLKELSSGTTER